MIIVYAALLLFFLYALLILYYHWGWRSVPDFRPPAADSGIKISVIIPARNEEENIGYLLQQLSDQTYPQHLFEVIVINDHSDDDTAAVVQQFHGVRLLNLEVNEINSYKKKAIETGIAAAGGDLIVTTDADCKPGSDWLKIVAAFKKEKDAVFIAAPVAFEHQAGLLQAFQTLDFLVLQGITAASVHRQFHYMCNGANLAYDKKAFLEIEGFKGIDKIASGDDMLLMKKMADRYPDKIFYLKSAEAIVTTLPAKTWKDFFAQRIRWASKMGFYNDTKITLVLALVYLCNLSFVMLLVASCIHPSLWFWLVLLLLAKTVVEFPFVYSVARFFKKQNLVWLFPFFQPLHILYIILAGWLGQSGKYEWKGRKVK